MREILVKWSSSESCGRAEMNDGSNEEEKREGRKERRSGSGTRQTAV